MPRNSFRALALVLILILSSALPAAAASLDERVLRRETGLLSWIWQWVGSLWPTAKGDLKAVTAAGGPLIDPNGIK